MGHGRREIRAKLCDSAVGGLPPYLDEAVPVCTALFLADLAGGIIGSRLRGFGLQGAREQVLGHSVSGGRGGCRPHPIRQHWLNCIRLVREIGLQGAGHATRSFGASVACAASISWIETVRGLGAIPDASSGTPGSPVRQGPVPQCR